MNLPFYQIAWMIQLLMNDKKPKAIYVAYSATLYLWLRFFYPCVWAASKIKVIV